MAAVIGAEPADYAMPPGGAKWQKFKVLVDAFIADVEDDGLHE